MGAVPLGGGPPMAPLPPLQSLGFGTSRWRLQGNATLGLRAGGRGHHVFFLLHKSTLPADFVAEVADESRKLRRRSAGAVAYHSLRWKRWLEATALAPSTRLQRDLTLIPRMGRPAVAAGRRAWPACGGSARWLPA